MKPRSWDSEGAESTYWKEGFVGQAASQRGSVTVYM
jgi:hypothetical protein